jgi:2-polyprenyl-6-hydroxyphenyl methylase/3-demethylubiquinone-9 3-methyltransferase
MDQISHDHPINNEFYTELGDRWYLADDDPVALLRAENKTKLPWIKTEISKHFKDLSSLKILDVGCGAGFATNYLAEYCGQVTGVDLAEGALQTAKKFETKPVNYILADARALPFKQEQFDVVVCLDFLEHVTEPEQIVDQIAKVLKPGGLFFYHTFSQNWLAYLVVIKGVEWFVQNTPPKMHTYDLFINHRSVHKWCAENQLDFQKVTGLRPKLNSAFFKMIRTGVVPKDFEFKQTSSLLVSYLGYAKK